MSFAADSAAIFAGPLAVDALYLSAASEGPPFPVRVIPQMPDQIAEFGASRFVAATAVFLLDLASVQNPSEGDTITLDAQSYVVQGVPLRDARRLRWRIEARPQ